MQKKIFRILIVIFILSILIVTAYIVIYKKEISDRSKAQILDNSKWIQINSLPESIGSYYGVAYDDINKRVYVVGGYVSLEHKGSKGVFKGILQSDGNILWSRQNDYPISVLGNACVTNSIRLYCFGGDDGNGNILSNSYVADINKTTGDIKSWQSYISLPYKVHFHAIIFYNNTIFIIGGRKENQGSPDPYLNEDATDEIYKLVSGQWILASHLPRKVDSPAVTVYNGYIYVGGGQITRYSSDEKVRCQISEVYFARINQDNSIGEWKRTTPYPDNENFGYEQRISKGIKAYHHMIAYNGYLYVLPSASFSSFGSCKIDDRVYLSSTLRSFKVIIKADGSLDNWITFGPINQELDNKNWIKDGMATNVYGAFISSGRVYLIGGMNYAGVTKAVFYKNLESCTPNCTNKQCGSNGCGGSCGSCSGQNVCVNGICVCQANCTNKECGESDGCSGKCTACESGYTCNTNTWKCESSQCKSNCTNKQCGDNGCGGSCGSCAGGEGCINNQCQEIEYDIDINGDGKIDMLDLTIILSNWKWEKEPRDYKADINRDGSVNMTDVSIILNNWTKKY